MQEALFNELTPNGIYNFYIFRDAVATDLFNQDNLLYLTQLTADESGTSSFNVTLPCALEDTVKLAIPAELIESETIDERIAGDANDDGEINLKDAVTIRRYIAGGWDVTINEANADVNGDGEVTLKDVVLIRRFIAGGWNVILL